MFQLGSHDVAIDLASGVLDHAILLAGMDFLLQGNDSACQLVSDHTNSDQPECLEFADPFGHS
jgi:hypothetical protein